MLPRMNTISEPVLDAADSNIDFAERGQSPRYG